VLSGDELLALLAACSGKSFEERRDTAIIRLFVDTGMRRAESLGLRVADVDFDQDVAVVLGKGSRPRACPFGNKIGRALGRYLRGEPALWLGKRGPLTETGLTPMLWRRSEQARPGRWPDRGYRTAAATCREPRRASLGRVEGHAPRTAGDRGEPLVETQEAVEHRMPDVRCEQDEQTPKDSGPTRR
jgi:integrase